MPTRYTAPVELMQLPGVKNNMKVISMSYPVSAVAGLTYWLLWFTPISYWLFGPDGSLFIVTGLVILGVMALQIILWSATGIRENTYKLIGKWQTTGSVLTVILFFMWGTYMLASPFIYGI